MSAIDLEDLRRFHNALPSFIDNLDGVIERIAQIQETLGPTLQQAIDLQDALLLSTQLADNLRHRGVPNGS